MMRPGGMFYVAGTVLKAQQHNYDTGSTQGGTHRTGGQVDLEDRSDNKERSQKIVESSTQSTSGQVDSEREEKKKMAPAIKKVSKLKESITKKWIKVDINEAHELLGHVGERSLRDTAKTLEWDLTGQLEVCTGCTEAKAKATAVPKNTTVKATRPGERLFTDISGPYANSVIGSRYWIMVVDDYSRMKWSFFRKNKSDIGKALEGFLVLVSGLGYTTKYLRCDDAGENTRHLSDLCIRRGIKIEFTTPHTPQLNGVVERAFVTVRQRAMAMMFAAQFTPEYQARLWAEAVNTATMLTNTVVNSVNKECPNDMFYGDILPKLRRKYADFKEFGRIGHVTIRTKLKKLDKKTFKGVFLGYSADHAADTYRICTTPKRTQWWTPVMSPGLPGMAATTL